jgi:cell division protein FtsI (penicillin-binding protein 3)
VEGRGVRLSLDVNIQYVVERELDAAWRRTGARAAVAVVLEPRTGDLLALAVRPTFNPNRFLDVPSPDVWRNRAITDPFEPGSTFKPIVAAAALEEGVVRPEDRIFAEEGRITIARTTIRDWKPYGWLTVAEVLQHSSNVGAIKVGLALGPARLYRYATAFGFGTPTGVGLAGESRGVLRDPGRWSALSLPALSIGQEVSVTALQLAAAFAAIANGGTLMRPRLVRAILDQEGRELQRMEPVAVRQVISAPTARTVTHLLVQVVERGTGQRAAIPGYTVAGKTGTAQKLDPTTRRYSRAPGVLSFVGFAPAAEPRFVLLVALDEPRTERWGSEAAAPVFAAIGREILRYLDVPPTGAAPVQIVTGAEPAEPPATRIQLASLARQGSAADPRAMPDVRGLALRPALAALAPLGLPVQAWGQGVVVAQRPAPGSGLDGASVVHLTLAPRLPAGPGAHPTR